MAKIRPAFGGVQTGGNSSAIVDGAAAALVASAGYADKHGQGAARAHRRRRRRRRAAGDHGHRPGAGDPGGAASAPACTLADIDRFEINEAFGAQVMACARELGLDEDKLNVNGGAIAIGHPLGATGVRLALTLARELKRARPALRHRVRLHRRRAGHRAVDRKPDAARKH